MCCDDQPNSTYASRVGLTLNIAMNIYETFLTVGVVLAEPFTYSTSTEYQLS